MGKKIVFEGVDGCGKETQYKLLREHLIQKGYDIAKEISFPQYEEESSYFVRQYLSGAYGNDPNSVSPKVASMFYAMDRYDFYHNEKNKPILEKLNDPNMIAVCNRDVTSNILFQAAKAKTKDEMHAIIDFICEIEYGIFKIPEPDMVIMPYIEFSKNIELLQRRDVGETAKKNNMSKDIHELNIDYLRRVHEASEVIAERMNFDVVNCIGLNGELKTPEEIHRDIYGRVKAKVLRDVRRRGV